MIRPRCGAAADPMLITGALGAAAALRRLRALLAELAADGDRYAPPSDTRGTEDIDDTDDTDDTDVVDVVLGLAALVAAVDRQLPDSPALPGVVDPAAEARQPINLLVKELLR